MIVSLVLYATEIIPIEATAILSCLAMYLFKIIDASAALSGFSNVALILAVGATMMGNALMETGALNAIGKRLGFLSNCSKKIYCTALCAISCALSACLSSFAIIVIMMSVADALVLKSSGKFTRKESYFPVAIGGSIGGAISLSGSGSILNAVSQYNTMVGYDAIGYFGPAVLAIPACLGAIVFYLTIGTKLQEKFFTFEDVPFSEEELAKAKELESGNTKPGAKMWISLAVFIGCALLWCFSKFNLGLVGLFGCAICLILKCVDRKAFDRCNWNALIVLATSLGFANGFHASGADTIIADAIINAFGAFGQSRLVMFIVVMIIATALTNIVSNNAAAAIVTPIAMMLAANVNCDARLWAICVGVCSNVAIFTPIGCANMTIILKGGYRFKDFVKVGLPITVISLVFIFITFAIIG